MFSAAILNGGIKKFCSSKRGTGDLTQRSVAQCSDLVAERFIGKAPPPKRRQAKFQYLEEVTSWPAGDGIGRDSGRFPSHLSEKHTQQYYCLFQSPIRSVTSPAVAVSHFSYDRLSGRRCCFTESFWILQDPLHPLLSSAVSNCGLRLCPILI